MRRLFRDRGRIHQICTLPIRRFYENRCGRSINSSFTILGKDRVRNLEPRAAIQQIRIFVGIKLTYTAIRRPMRAGRVEHIYPVSFIISEKGRTLIDKHWIAHGAAAVTLDPLLLPLIFRSGNHHSLPGKFSRACHLGNINVLPLGIDTLRLPAGPDHI